MNKIELPSIIAVYLDSLTDEERDRVIEAKVFTIGGGYIRGSKGGKEIVKNTHKVYRMDGFGRSKRTFLYSVTKEVEIIHEPTDTQGCLIDHAKAGTSREHYSTVGSAFDIFYRNHKEEAIRLIKEYAARLNKIEIQFDEPEEAETREAERVEEVGVHTKG